MPTNLITGVPTETALSVARAQNGDVFAANGLQRPMKWDGILASTENAGIDKASTLTATTGVTAGNISGVYVIGVRFLDRNGVPGDISDRVTLTIDSRTRTNYTGIPTSTDSRITQREIYRSTDGQTRTLYLDVTLSNNTGTTAHSTVSDANLLLSTALPILNPFGASDPGGALRFGVPPSDKEVVISHQQRTFWAVDSSYSQGHIAMVTGEITGVIVGGNVHSSFDRRRLRVIGNNSEFTISGVSPAINTINLINAYTGPTDVFAQYDIHGSKSDRNKIFWSVNGEPESVPAENNNILNEDGADGDEITGMMQLDSYIYILQERHIHRWVYQGDPGTGDAYLSANRGCLNQRCWVRVDGAAYLMDREGIYQFTGGSVDAISQPIQNIFRKGVVWQHADRFHASEYPSEETIKFFVCLDGSYYPRHALCYHWRRRAWWVEEYPWQVASSSLGDIQGVQRMLVGAEHERVDLTSEGLLDGPKKTLTTWDAVASATPASITLSAYKFTAADILGSHIHIVKGRGKGQKRRILTANASTGLIEIREPWGIIPDDTSFYQIGGVPWKARFKDRRAAGKMGQEVERRVYVGIDKTASTGSFDIRKYYDGATTAKINVMQFDDVGGDKVIGSPDTEVDTTRLDRMGWDAFDFTEDQRGGTTRRIQIELRGVQNKDAMVVRSLELRGLR